MKAAVVVTPGNLEVRDLPEPIVGDYDVLCKTIATGICSGTDTHIIDGLHYKKIFYPTVLGHEGIGKVIGIGKKVRHINLGDVVTRVFNVFPSDSPYSIAYGAFAEYSVATDWQAMRDDALPQSQWDCYRVHRVLPEWVDPVASTMIITWRETLSFLTRMDVSSGQSVCIIGSGANAMAFLEHTRNKSFRITVIGSSLREKLFLSAGANLYIPYTNENVAGTLYDNNTQFDLIIDTIGDCLNLDAVIPFLGDKGKIGLYGLNAYHEYRIPVIKAQGDIQFFNGELYDEASAHDVVIEQWHAGMLNHEYYISKEYIYHLNNISDAFVATRERKTLKCIVTY